jgi:hypothetical protein
MTQAEAIEFLQRQGWRAHSWRAGAVGLTKRVGWRVRQLEVLDNGRVLSMGWRVAESIRFALITFAIAAFVWTLHGDEQAIAVFLALFLMGLIWSALE